MNNITQMPEGWIKTTLADVTHKIGSGATPTGGAEAYKPSGISLIRSQNILNFSFSYNGLAFIDEIQAKKLDYVSIQPKDVLINITGDSVARVCMPPKDVIPARVNQHVAILRANIQKIDSDFLLYYLLNPYYQSYLLQLASSGATRKALTKTILNNLEITLPSLPEQKAIAEILTSFGNKIENIQNQNKTLDIATKALFDEWFGKHQINDELLEGFERITLGEIIKSANTGLDAIKRAPIVAEETGIKCFRIQDASQKKQYSDWGNTKVEEKNYTRFKLLKGDILIARTGNSIGVNYLVKEDLNSVFNNGLIRLRVNSKSSYPFLYMIITSKRFEKHVQSIAHGTSTQPNMQINALLSYELLLPPLSEQKRFDDVFKPIMEKQRTNQAQIQTLKRTRDTLLPKLMSGEIRVNDFKE